MKNIKLISTGGTIASIAGKDGKSIAGALPGEALVEHLQLPDNVRLSVESTFQKPSNAITMADLCVLAKRCQALIDEGTVHGIVITHGTDTLEDTSYFLESVLTLNNTAVVVTGSQRVPHADGSDAFTNLSTAITVACHPRTPEMGVVVAFNESIFCASTVRKVNSYQVNGFAAPGYGRLGLVDGTTTTYFQQPLRLPTLPLAQDHNTLPDVDIVPSYLDASPFYLEQLLHHGKSGVVIDGLGRGHVPPQWMPIIRQLCQMNRVVLVCSATLMGGTYQTYEFTGSLQELEAAGAIAISHLSARKARLRLALLLSQGTPTVSTIRAAFKHPSS